MRTKHSDCIFLYATNLMSWLIEVETEWVTCVLDVPKVNGINSGAKIEIVA